MTPRDKEIEEERQRITEKQAETKGKIKSERDRYLNR